MIRYTLDEARKLLAREECDEHGHDLEGRHLTRLAAPVIHQIRCVRCGARFEEVAP